MLATILSLFALLANAQILMTTNGPVRGQTRDGVTTWKGIPFAAPPIGANRLRPPQPVKKWTHVRDASESSQSCYQSLAFGLPFGSEDCLYLDVYKTATNSTKPLPIMIWIYGGGWQNGDSYFFGLYDATHLVQKEPHIHVAMNYRLRAAGFLAMAEAYKESGTTGNYGLLDQRFAMQWVKDNAAALGGDVNNVAIFGESAGAFSVCWHLAAPGSAGLFTRAILESTNCDSGDFFAPRAQTQNFSDNYIQPLGCANAADRLQCLRALSTEEFFAGDVNGDTKLAPALPWVATLEQSPHSIDCIPTRCIEQGRFNKVPMMIGNNQNEGVVFVLIVPTVTGVSLPMDQHSFKTCATKFWNATVADLLLPLYDHLDTYEDILSAAIRDWFFACSSRRTAQAFEKHGVPAYVYHYTFLPDNWIDDQLLGDYHSAELEYVFGNAWPPVVHNFDARDKKMVDAMQRYWLSMGLHGEPNRFNGNVNPFWPVYTTANRTDARLDLPVIMEQNYRAVVCDALWDHVLPQT